MGNCFSGFRSLTDDHQTHDATNFPGMTGPYITFQANSLGGFSELHNTDEANMNAPHPDRRTEITLSGGNMDDHHKALGKLITNFRNAQEEGKLDSAGGTAALVRYNHSDKIFILTAAHCLLREGLKPEFAEAQSVIFQWQKSITSTPVNLRFESQEWKRHPSFKGKWKYGDDVAIIKISTAQRKLLGKNPSCLLLDRSLCLQSQKKTPVFVSGYPGNKPGGLWEHSGPIDSEGEWSSKQEHGGCYAYYEPCEAKARMLACYGSIDTSPGQSGSPVVKKSNTEKNMMVLAVHVAGIKGNANYGTALKKDVLDWIEKQIGVPK